MGALARPAAKQSQNSRQRTGVDTDEEIEHKAKERKHCLVPELRRHGSISESIESLIPRERGSAGQSELYEIPAFAHRRRLQPKLAPMRFRG